MDYPHTIDYLFTRLPMFSRIGAAAFKKDLTNTIRLCEYLGDPHTKFRSVHIAGTNGKGSVSHMLAAILQASGYKTGLYTSPHLKDFRERIKINGQMIREEAVVDFVDRMQPVIETVEPSFFEITVAMAFDHFAREQVDIAIIETGLGGRLDSTNIVRPGLSVITNIGWDHMNILGDTLQQIAFEKAGIIKKGVPVVIGESQAAVRQVFIQKALEEEAPIIFADHERYVTGWSYDHHHLLAEVGSMQHDDRKQYQLDLAGFYQTRNLVTTLEAVAQLQQKGWTIPEKQLQEALRQVTRLTGLHGRWETIRHRPDLVLDVGHNEDGMKEIAAQLELTDYHELHIVIGLVKDKEVEKILSFLPREACYYFTKAHIPRALPEEVLAAKAAGLGLEGACYPTVNGALRAALQKAGKKDLVLVCGSVFVVGEAEPEALVTESRV